MEEDRLWDKSNLYYWNLNDYLSGATECTNDATECTSDDVRWNVPPCWVFYSGSSGLDAVEGDSIVVSGPRNRGCRLL